MSQEDDEDFLRYIMFPEEEEEIEEKKSNIPSSIPIWFYGFKVPEKCTKDRCIGPFQIIKGEFTFFIECTNCKRLYSLS